ncbi:MAG: hypothetical protein HYZ42_09590 [Bacteroidetes bacterium]|nr:hypothetical protein [Bacteroidota bacterium]
MGSSPTISGYQLEETVKQGFVDYLCSLESSDNQKNKTVGVSTLLLGCGYAGLNVETSLKAIISAAHKANELVRNNGDSTWPVIDSLELIELYEDRALQALICLEALKRHGIINFSFDAKMQRMHGSRRRLNFDNSVDGWQRISIGQESDCCNKSDKNTTIVFNASTGSAREEVRKLHASKDIIESLVTELSSSYRWNEEVAKTIFELLTGDGGLHLY